MITPNTEDPTTQAQIYVEEGHWPGKETDTTTYLRLIDTVAFSYSSDILQLGDPFTVTVPNPTGHYTSRFTRGSKIRLYLKNPSVNGGQPALKHTGVIVKRSASCSLQGGTSIRLDCADLGWHLQNNDAHLFYKLRYGTLEHLLRDPLIIDPSWGIVDLRTDNEINRLIKQGKNAGRAGATVELNPQLLAPLYYVQVEPGDRVADLIIAYCKRINVLVNVSADGYLQLFRPNYNQKPLYRIDFHGLDEHQPNPNNVLDAHMEEDLTQIYTQVTCVGEVLGTELQQVDTTQQNAAKRAGTFPPKDSPQRRILPFKRNINFCDGDLFSSTSAKKQAEWFYNRRLFDSWSATYTVRGHHQNGNWWESDTLCEVHDSVLGIDGNLYVQAVRCDRDEHGGDRTTVTLRKPGLLQASFGVYPRAGRIKSTPPAQVPEPTAADQAAGASLPRGV